MPGKSREDLQTRDSAQRNLFSIHANDPQEFYRLDPSNLMSSGKDDPDTLPRRSTTASDWKRRAWYARKEDVNTTLP